MDRLGRSLRDLANIVHEIEASGANLRVIEQSVDTGTSDGRAFFGMLAVFAQFQPMCVASDRPKASLRPRKPASILVANQGSTETA